jgi:hypothetical protein
MPKAEDLIRDYLAENIRRMTRLVRNLKKVREEWRRNEQQFLRIDPKEGGPTARDLLQRIIAKRNLLGLHDFQNLHLVGTEFKLLSTGLAGKQPSADILAINPEVGVFFVPEVKQDVGAERQAVTELSAYSQGLQNRFWGLSPADHVWVPISTEWRTAVRAGFANEIVWGNRAILPMKCRVKFISAQGASDQPEKKVSELELELLNVVEDMSEVQALAHFAWDCFDSLEIAMVRPPSDPRTFLDFIVATASRLALSGFVLFYEYRGLRRYPEPYTFHIAATNPARAALKREQLKRVLENDQLPDPNARLIDMRKYVGDSLWDWLDIDLASGKVVEPDDLRRSARKAEREGNEEEAKKLRAELASHVSVAEIARASGNRLSNLFREVQSRLNLFLPRYTLGSPSSGTLLQNNKFQRDNKIHYVGYFGVMSEAVYERLIYEFHNASESGQGPVLGELGGDPVRMVSETATFFQFMALMNYQHRYQDTYRAPPWKPQE